MSFKRKRYSTIGPTRVEGDFGIKFVGTVQVATRTGGGTVTSPTYSSLVMPGDLILATAGHQGASIVGITISSSGLTFTPATYSDAGYSSTGIWYAVSPDATSRTVSATVSSTTASAIAVWVLRNVHSSPIDVASNGALGAVNPMIVPTYDTTYTASLAFNSMFTYDPNTPNVQTTNGWQSLVSVNCASGGSLALGYKTIASAGATGDMSVSLTSTVRGSRYSRVAIRSNY